MKHTKGPWTVGEESSIAAGCIEIEGDLCPVAHVEKWDTLSETSQREAEANAHLIAAAPELLEALRAIVFHHGLDDEAGREDLLRVIREGEFLINRVDDN